MNSIEFLLSLNNTNHYLQTIHSDLLILIEHFNPAMFDNNFHEFPFNGETFLEQLRIDLESATTEQITALADVILYYQHCPNVNWPLLNLLRVSVKNYMVKIPNALNIKKYYSILVSAIVHDMQKSLDRHISISFGTGAMNILASVSSISDNSHELSVKEPSIILNNSAYIYIIFMPLYIMNIIIC